MYIQSIDTNSLIETENPLKIITPTLKKSIGALINKDGYINNLTAKSAIGSIRLTIICTTIVIACIPIIVVITVGTLMVILIPNNFTFMNPIHVIKLMLLFTIVFSGIPFVLLVYNSKLVNCMYLSILLKIIKSFNIYKNDVTNREELFTHYLKLANKEWNYYDCICKLQ